MTRSRKRKLKRAGLAMTTMPLASTLLTVSPIAQTQEPEDTGGLDEVVVSAQKRDESLQDVPISVNALSGNRLEELHASNFEEYVQFLPSVSFQTTAPGFSFVYMRGVASGENGNHSTSQPTVGVYLDEQPVTTIQGALDLHMYDIARVESLAGPQGTLYGASSEAGTLRVITNKPDPTGFEAGYDLEANSVSSGDQGYVAEGFVNIPIGEASAVRLVGWYDHGAGYIDNVAGSRTFPTSGGCVSNANPTPPGCQPGTVFAEKNYNDSDTYGARAALRVDLNDSWTVTPTIMGQRTKVNGGFAMDPLVGDLERTHFYPDNFKDEWWQAALTVQGKLSNLEVVYAGAYLKRDDETNLDYSDYSYFYDLQGGSGAYWYDDDGVPLADPSQYIEGADAYSKQSHEIRIASPQDRRVRFVTGLFYQRQSHSIFQDYRINGLSPTVSVGGLPGSIWLTTQQREDREKALFGEITFDVTEKLSVTGGLRAFETENSLVGFFGYGAGYSSNYGEALCFSDAPFRTAPCTNLDDSVDEDGVIPKVNLSYKITDDKMVYATYSRGFRPGGINRNGTVPPYETEYLDNHEIGWKTTWANNRLRFNGALFFEKLEDIQFSFLPPSGSGLSVVRNAGAAEVKGLESEIAWAASDALTVTGGFSLIDAELTEPYLGYGTEEDPDAPIGTRLPVSAKFKANATARYEFPLGSWGAFAQGAVVYNGGAYSDLLPADRVFTGKSDAYTIVDVSAGIRRDAYAVELYVANATDERAQLYTVTECATDVCGVNPYIYANRPRTIGLKFSQKF
jgi:iron complex outermembrane receptor protein